MTGVARYSKVVAKAGSGDELARRLLDVAEGLQDAAGCQLYVINRAPGAPDEIWVTEIWRSREDLEAALASETAQAAMPGVLELVDGDGDGGERIELEPVGGLGYPPERAGFSIVNLEEVEDAAAKFGLGHIGEARFARTLLSAVGIGLGLQRLRPGMRQEFGHRHAVDEEIYVVLQGSGQVAVDDDVRDIRAMDAIRVAPRSVRAFQAGPDGLTMLSTGTHHPGDAEMLPGFWPSGG